MQAIKETKQMIRIGVWLIRVKVCLGLGTHFKLIDDRIIIHAIAPQILRKALKFLS